VYNTSSDSLGIDELKTLQIDRILLPCFLAILTAASVSAVSPD